MHPGEGELLAYLDNQLDPVRREQTRHHLAACPECRDLAHELEQRAARITRSLDLLSPARDAAPLPTHTARARLQARLEDKEKTTMFQRIFDRPYRPAWAAASLILVLALSLVFPPVRAIANSFLGLFRVQQVAVVQVNPGNLPNQLGSSTQFESLFAQNVKVQQDGEVQDAENGAAASQMAGFGVRLPAGSLTKLTVQPAGSMVYTVNSAQLQAVLDEIGRSDIQVPAGLDAAEVSLQVFPSVTAMYGDCSFDMEAARRNGYDPDNPQTPRLPECTTLLQMPSPTISAPAGLDIAGLGEAFLQLMGLSADEAASFSRNVDWTTTFVIPIPRYGTTYQDVSVDGVTGTFIQQDTDGYGHQYMLIWVKDGILYALTGPGELQDAQDLAGQLQ